MSHLQQNEQTKDWRWVDVDSNGTSSSTPSVNLSEAISNVHDPDYIEYLQSAYESWVGDGGSKAAVIPEVFPHPGLLSTASQNAIKNKNISPLAKAGLYCFDLSCPITADTFGSAMAAVRVVLEASWHLILEAEEYRIQSAETAETDRTRPGVFALTRPPGHHAASAVCGGYCFFNNAAIAARFLQSKLGS
ncbi:hypothetical protein FRC12_015523 [Ceratobasidium sp. 428]|nr:hypothetical protein FRC12_015523 [Ceratobasidium sp. 428]